MGYAQRPARLSRPRPWSALGVSIARDALLLRQRCLDVRVLLFPLGIQLASNFVSLMRRYLVVNHPSALSLIPCILAEPLHSSDQP